MIPNELDQSDLPTSFRFYDTIINETKLRFPEPAQIFNAYKNTMRIGYQKNETILTKVLEFIGAQGEAGKLSLRHSHLNPILTHDIDYHLSHDCT